MASDPHRNEQIDVYTALRARFAGPDCYVSFDKPVRYGKLGVREYFVINPAGLYASHDVRVQGCTLDSSGGKIPLPAASDGGVNSVVLPCG